MNTIVTSSRSPQPSSQQTFLSRYEADVLEPSKIHFVVPMGISVLDILREANVLAPTIYNLNAVWPSRLEAWSRLESFQQKVVAERRITLNAVVNGTEWKTATEQLEFLRANNLRLAILPHVAAAHAINFIATGKDLFNGRIIRIEDVSLYYGDGGLSQMDKGDYIPNCRYQHVMTAAEEW